MDTDVKSVHGKWLGLGLKHKKGGDVNLSIFLVSQQKINCVIKYKCRIMNKVYL